MTGKKIRQGFAVLLAGLILLGAVPAAAFAAESGGWRAGALEGLETPVPGVSEDLEEDLEDLDEDEDPEEEGDSLAPDEDTEEDDGFIPDEDSEEDDDLDQEEDPEQEPVPEQIVDEQIEETQSTQGAMRGIKASGTVETKDSVSESSGNAAVSAGGQDTGLEGMESSPFESADGTAPPSLAALKESGQWFLTPVPTADATQKTASNGTASDGTASDGTASDDGKEQVTIDLDTDGGTLSQEAASAWDAKADKGTKLLVHILHDFFRRPEYLLPPAGKTYGGFQITEKTDEQSAGQASGEPAGQAENTTVFDVKAEDAFSPREYTINTNIRIRILWAEDPNANTNTNTHTHSLRKVEAKAADCETDGHIEYWVCDQGENPCGKYFADAAGTKEISLEDTVEEAAGHVWDEGKVTKEPTCTEKGVRTFTCLNNSEHTETEEIEAIGHDWGEWTVTKEATESEEGVETRTCKNDPSHKETRPVAKTAHTHALTKVAAVPADCETDGHIEYWVCDQGENPCGKYFADAAGTKEIRLEDTVEEAAGHVWDEGKVTKEPTCTEKGVRTFTCLNNSEHTETEEIEATGHDWGEWKESKAPTCSAPGEEERICKNDATHKETRETDIDVEAHTWDKGKVTTEPTCTEEGVRTYTCKNNKAHMYTDSIEPTGHDWGPWIVTKNATAKAEGVETRTCKNDPSHTETRAIAKLPQEAEILYTPTEASALEWTQGSGESAVFIFERSENDEETYKRFTSLLIDGKSVDKSNYTKEPGSVIIAIKPAYMETYPAGKHTVTAQFTDGTATAEFRIIAADRLNAKNTSSNSSSKDSKKSGTKKDSSSGSKTSNSSSANSRDNTAAGAPGTGDSSRPVLWIALLAGSLAALIAIIVYRRRKNGKQQT